VTLLVLFVMAFVTALSGALMPGPVLFITVRQSVEHGRWVGPLIVAGHALVELPLVTAIALGLHRFAGGQTFLGVVGLAGGTVLLAMGGLMLSALPRLQMPRAAPGIPSVMGKFRTVAAGAVTTVANPSFPLWWATIGLAFMATHARPAGIVGYAVFYVAHILGDLAWYAAVSEGVHRGRRLLSNTGYRWLVGCCAALLMAFAAYFVVNGVRHLSA